MGVRLNDMEDYEKFNLKFCTSYLEHLLKALDHLSQEQLSDTMRQCSECHYTALAMDEVLSEYVENIEGFLVFLTKQWGWKISYDIEMGIIIADENKPECVCPIVAAAKDRKISPNLCFCSEGFAARMFSKVCGYEVKTKIAASILRGDAHCVYEIQL